MSESAMPSPPTPEPSAADLPRESLGSRAATAPFALSQEPLTPEGAADPLAPDAAPAPAFEHLGELPATYGTQSLYLVAYDPHQLFAYWDIDWSPARGSEYALQVKCDDGSIETRIDLAPNECSRYIRIARPGARYFTELSARGRDGRWRALATSGPVTMPPEGVAAESEPAFATLPFHLSFQRLIDLLHGAMRPNEDLSQVLARLQGGGDLAASPSLLGSLASLEPDQLRTLELLVAEGFEPREAPAPSSGDLTGSEGLSSPGSSGWGRFGGSGSEALPSSALGGEVRLAAAAAGAEALSSSGASSRGRWLGAGLSSETLSSSGARQRGPLFPAGGMGSETLSSRGGLSSRSLFSAGGGLSSGAFAAGAARGSEILGSAARPGFGLSSEAWRRVRAGEAGGSESLASDQGAVFSRAMQSNLETVDSQSGGGSGGLSSALSSRGRP